jgi:hypothetical protein
MNGYALKSKPIIKNVQKDADCKTDSSCFTSTIKVGGAAVCTDEMDNIESSMKTFVELPQTDGTGDFKKVTTNVKALYECCKKDENKDATVEAK